MIARIIGVDGTVAPKSEAEKEEEAYWTPDEPMSPELAVRASQECHTAGCLDTGGICCGW